MTRYPSQILRRQLNAIKRKQFPWMLEFSKNAPQIATIQLGEAKNFSLTNDQFTVEDSRLRIPNLGGCGYYLSPSL
jgi:putative transposase